MRPFTRLWLMLALAAGSIALAVTAAAAACPEAHSVDSLHRLPSSNASFIARAETICARARKQLDALPAFPFQDFDPLHPDPRMLPKVGRFFTGPGNELPIVRRLYKQLYALGDPPNNRRAWHSVLATIREFIAVFVREDKAALAADVPAWVKAVRENRRAHKRMAATTAAFGARRCDVL